MTTLLVLLLLVGAAAMVLAGVGIVRMPDLYLRMQAATKSSTLGIAALGMATALHHGSTEAWWAVGLLLAFFFLTGPVAAHALGRAAWSARVPFWEPTRFEDEPSGAEHSDDRAPPCPPRDSTDDEGRNP